MVFTVPIVYQFKKLFSVNEKKKQNNVINNFVLCFNLHIAVQSNQVVNFFALLSVSTDNANVS